MKYIIMLMCMGISVTLSVIAQPVEDQSHLTLIQNAVDAISDKDPEAMSSLLHEDFEGYGPAYGDVFNKFTYLAYWGQMWPNFKSIEYNRQRILEQTIEEGEDAGDWVLDWIDFKVTVYNTPNPVTFRSHTAYLVKDGKILKAVSYYNMLDVFEQLGFKLIPPSQ